MPAELAERVYALITVRPGALLSLCLAYGRDASSFDPNAAPPQTAAKCAMMEAVRADWAQRIHDEYAAGRWPFGGDAVTVADVMLMLGNEYQPMPSSRAVHQELFALDDGVYSVLAQRRNGAVKEQRRVIVLRNISSWKEAGPTALYAHYDETVIKGMGGRTQL